MPSLKLLLLNYEYPPIGGGGGFGCEKLAQGLSQNLGYEVTVLTAGIGAEIETTKDQSGVTVIRLPCSLRRVHRSSASFAFMLIYNIKSILYIWRNRKKFFFDVISTQFAIPTGPAGFIISKILKTPNVLTLHGGEILKQPLELSGYKNPLINFVVRFVIKSADSVMANSNDTKLAAQKLLGITRPIQVLSTGFSPPDSLEISTKIKPHEKNEQNIPVKLIMVSRLVERKNLSDLFLALASLKNLSWNLQLIGDGPEESKLRQLANDLHIDDRISFLGFVSEKEKFFSLQQADLFVLPTLHEGLGLVYFEAMHCGLPIITTNNGGQTDFLQNEINALLIPIRDINALKEALEKGITDLNWRKTCGQNNREKIKSLYLEKLLPDYDLLFREVL